MAQIPASVTIQQLPTGTTVTGSELIEAVQTSGGQANSVQLSLNTIVSSILGIPVSVSSGGTGTTALTAFGVAFGNGTAAIGVTAAGTTALPLVGNGTALAPSFQVLPVSGGGNGTSTLTPFGVQFGNGTSVVGITAAGNTALVLISPGPLVAPTFGQVSLTAAVTGVLGVPNGGQGTSTLTANAVLYGAGTSTVGLLVAGATGQMLMGQGAAPPVMQYPGMTLLNTLTANGVASVSDLTSINGTFNDYMFVADNIVPSALTTLLMRVQVGGTIQTTSYVGAVTNGIDLTNGSSVASTAGAGFSGFIYLFNVNSTSVNKMVSGRGLSYSGPTTAAISNMGGAYNGSQGAVTGVSFLPTGGTFTGTFRIYGMRTT